MLFVEALKKILEPSLYFEFDVCVTKTKSKDRARVPFVPSTKIALKFTQITNHEQ